MALANQNIAGKRQVGFGGGELDSVIETLHIKAIPAKNCGSQIKENNVQKDIKLQSTQNEND